MSKTEPIRLTRAQIREIDRRAIEEYGIPGIVLMENAARGAADLILHAFHDFPEDMKPPRALIICGGGNNGGDAFAVARHLHNRGVEVSIIETANADRLPADARLNRAIAQKMALEIVSFEEDLRDDVWAHDFVIDALFGTGLVQAPRGNARDWIKRINDLQTRKHIYAIDVPSGLDCDTGEPIGDLCVCAHDTITFVAEKIGFANPSSRQFTGNVTIADIGCPRELIDIVRREMP